MTGPDAGVENGNSSQELSPNQIAQRIIKRATLLFKSKETHQGGEKDGEAYFTSDAALEAITAENDLDRSFNAITASTDIEPRALADTARGLMSKKDLGDKPWDEFKLRLASQIVSQTLRKDPEIEQADVARYKFSTTPLKDKS